MFYILQKILHRFCQTTILYASFVKIKYSIFFCAGEDNELGNTISKEKILNGPIFEEGTPLLYASIVSQLILIQFNCLKVKNKELTPFLYCYKMIFRNSYCSTTNLILLEHYLTVGQIQQLLIFKVEMLWKSLLMIKLDKFILKNF